jgi:hypothetical protein
MAGGLSAGHNQSDTASEGEPVTAFFLAVPRSDRWRDLEQQYGLCAARQELGSYCRRRLNAASIAGWNLARNSVAS